MKTTDTACRIKRVTRTVCLLISTGVGAAQAESVSVPSPVGMSNEVLGSGFMLQFVAGLACVLLCVVGLAWLMRRLGRLQSSANGALKMIDGLALSTRERLVLVQVGTTQVLLGVAPGRVEAVHVLEKPIEEKTNGKQTGTFSARLKDALAKEKSL